MRGGGRRESVRKREEKQEKGEYGIVLSDAGEREKGGWNGRMKRGRMQEKRNIG